MEIMLPYYKKIYIYLISQGAIHNMYIKKNNKTNIHFSHLTEHVLQNNILP